MALLSIEDLLYIATTLGDHDIDLGTLRSLKDAVDEINQHIDPHH